MLTARAIGGSGVAVGQTRFSGANFGVKGRSIVAVSDADMVPLA